MEEVSDLLYLANQMGLITVLFGRALDMEQKRGVPFSMTQNNCKTWRDIQESQMEKENEKPMKLRDIRGMLILLTIGLCASLITFFAELIMHNVIKKIRTRKQVTRQMW